MKKTISIVLVLIIIAAAAVYALYEKERAPGKLSESDMVAVLESLSAPAERQGAPFTEEQKQALLSLTAPSK